VERFIVKSEGVDGGTKNWEKKSDEVRVHKI